MEKVVPLTNVSQQYAWGKVGKDSAVAQLQLGNPDFILQEDKPYAELWFGTHPSGASKVKLKKGAELVELSKWIRDHPTDTLGEQVSKHWGDLPFLFKVLSIRTALSIQAHPDRTLARILHASQPEVYHDPNHKPEIAIALTTFEALCRFRTIKEIAEYVKSVPELRAVVGEIAAAAFDEIPPSESARLQALKTLFTALMNAPADLLETQLKLLISRLQQGPKDKIDELALRLHAQYPGDVGVFSVYLLNYVILKPGEGLYMGANEPHAYISGDCVECMATSDNVVRAGLTPKFKDVGTLCNMLTYAAGAPQLLMGVVAHESGDGAGITRVYAPPVEEFQVEYITVKSGNSYTLRTTHGPSILLIHDGSGEIRDADNRTLVKSGVSLFVSADTSLTLTANNNNDKSLVVFRACVNEAFWR